MTVAITGANGNLGQRLLNVLDDARALVRSQRAAETVSRVCSSVDTAVVNYDDAAALTTALRGCTRVVHLVGIIKESRGNRYEQAHEASCRALVEAAEAAGVQQIVYLSIVGSRPDAANACLASKGRAEALLHAGAVPAFVLRVPMVLGEGDYASFALGKRARASMAFAFRAASLEQPVYAGDVVAFVAHVLGSDPEARTVELGGPEVLTRRALTHRAAIALGVAPPPVFSLPLVLGLALAGALELLPNPPVTRAMLGVLDHDDQVPVPDYLPMALTPLDEMLVRCLPRP